MNDFSKTIIQFSARKMRLKKPQKSKNAKSQFNIESAEIQYH